MLPSPAASPANGRPRLQVALVFSFAIYFVGKAEARSGTLSGEPRGSDILHHRETNLSAHMLCHIDEHTNAMTLKSVLCLYQFKPAAALL